MNIAANANLPRATSTEHFDVLVVGAGVSGILAGIQGRMRDWRDMLRRIEADSRVPLRPQRVDQLVWLGLTDTTVANKTLVIESVGIITGSITYADLEIKKGGSMQGNLMKVKKGY